MTAPLTPPECDLRGYEYMPLYGHHLFGSEFNGKVSDQAWRAAVTLWWAAWNQVPAASLPNDDAALTRLAELGRDVKTFRKIKEHALYRFVLCSDGRLYHPKLAAWAIKAWEARLKDRARKQRYRDGHKPPPDDPPKETSPERLPARPDDVQGNVDVRVEGKAKRSEASTKPNNEGLDVNSAPPVDNPKPVAILAEKRNGKSRSLPALWWKTDQGILAAALASGIKPLPGQDYEALKNRIFEHEKRQREAG